MRLKRKTYNSLDEIDPDQYYTVPSLSEIREFKLVYPGIIALYGLIRTKKIKAERAGSVLIVRGKDFLDFISPGWDEDLNRVV